VPAAAGTFAFDALDAVSIDGAGLSGVADEIAVLAALTGRRRTA
jgi:hypothetical protein